MFVMWIVRLVVSLDTGLVCYSAELLGICGVSISSVGGTLERGGNISSFPGIFVTGFLVSRRGCLGGLGVFFLSVVSVDRVIFGARDESGGCVGGSFCFAYSMSLFALSTMAVS